MSGLRTCFLCGRNGTADPLDKHHIFGGAFREKSEKDGLTVYLCHERCHIFGTGAAHRNAGTMRMLREYGERQWLSRRAGRKIEDFIERYGRNYLEEYAAPGQEEQSFKILDEEELPF